MGSWVPRTFLVVTLGFGLVSSSCAGRNDCLSPGMGSLQARPGELTVRFKDSVISEAQARGVIDTFGFSIRHFVNTSVPLSAAVAVPEGSECTSADRLRQSPDVATAAPSFVVSSQ